MTGWDGWTASPTLWTWVWASSGSWWWTGMPGVLQSIGSQRVWHDWATELNWTDFGLGNDFLDVIPKAQVTKGKICNWLQNLKTASKDTQNKSPT